MYKEHTVFEPPQNEDAKIWRYMDFTKFVSLLDKSALFFTRADQLGDSFEGALSKANKILRPKEYGDTIPASGFEQIDEIFKQYKKFTFISSWFLNEYELAAMWKTYLTNNQGIAIQSSYKALRDCLIDQKYDIHIGKVKYIDYHEDWMPERNTFSPFIHKRKYYALEHEIRAVIQVTPIIDGKINLLNPPFDNGIYIEVELDKLVDKIYVAPTCPLWIMELTRSVIAKYQLKKEVTSSNLDDVPS
jgi:hypothetical protein